MKNFVFAVLLSSLLAGCNAIINPEVPEPPPECADIVNLELFNENGLIPAVDETKQPLQTQDELNIVIKNLYGEAALAEANKNPEAAKLEEKSAYHSHYHPVCPAVWYSVPYWKWYFMYKDMKCHAIYSYSFSDCVHNYCNMNFNWALWSKNHVCRDEIVVIYIPAVCYTSTGQWVGVIVPRKIPQGCCCSRYYPFALSSTLQCKDGN